MPVQTEAYVMLSMVLFVLGTLGVLLKRNAILVFMAAFNKAPNPRLRTIAIGTSLPTDCWLPLTNIRSRLMRLDRKPSPCPTAN